MGIHNPRLHLGFWALGAELLFPCRIASPHPLSRTSLLKGWPTHLTPTSPALPLAAGCANLRPPPCKIDGNTTLDGKNSTAPEKTLKKHVFLGLKKNTKKHQGAGGGGGGLLGPERREKVAGKRGDTENHVCPEPGPRQPATRYCHWRCSVRGARRDPSQQCGSACSGAARK
jgi:hypothetical protein